MSNNKQSSVEWYIIERHNIEIQSRLGKISSTQYDEQLIKIEEQAKAMRKDEIKNAQMGMFIHLNNLPYGLEYLEKRQSAEDFSQQYYNETFGDESNT